MAFDPNQVGIAYLVVGSTGTGKSSLINLFCGNEAHVGHGADAGTTQIHLYKHQNGKDILIDTVGIEDPNGATDEEIMIQTLRFLQENKIEHVAVIWTVNPTPRASQPLQKQAKYIDSLRSKDIWDSTMMIVKQAPQIEQNSQGAREAAKEFHKGVKVPAITYNCVDWLQGADKQLYETLSAQPGRDEILKTLFYFSSKEVKKLVENTLISLTKESCKIIFNDSQCIKCGAIGDERCMPEKCHIGKKWDHKVGAKLEKSRKHTGTAKTVTKDVKYEKMHTGKVEYFHNGAVVDSYTYFIAKSWNWNNESKYDCCGMWKGSQGCKKRWTCCGQDDDAEGCNLDKTDLSETVMSCCNLPESVECGRATDYWTCCQGEADSKGCVEICKLCRKVWNNSEHVGCMPITMAPHECKKINE